jgi:hypothetical protein
MRWTLEELDTWRGREVLDADAEPVGEVVSTFVDDQTRAPRWLAVRTGAHGDDLSPVPIEGAEPTGAGDPAFASRRHGHGGAARGAR